MIKLEENSEDSASLIEPQDEMEDEEDEMVDVEDVDEVEEIDELEGSEENMVTIKTIVKMIYRMGVILPPHCHRHLRTFLVILPTQLAFPLTVHAAP